MSQNESPDQISAPSASRSAWPSLRPSLTEPCDGENPDTGAACVLGYHDGYHRDAGRTEWLDDE
ncbi:hypothetical protein E0H92_07735 [Kribbella speibonae]|uniref:Uncharacterized protein n=1 Tax=Kribbella speibonae TaxID=1572660 RepID=A0A4R0J8C4_9ACTN|nr:hypothetical protein E0H92_07735 [Kribbella speibonae]